MIQVPLLWSDYNGSEPNRSQVDMKMNLTYSFYPVRTTKFDVRPHLCQASVNL